MNDSNKNRFLIIRILGNDLKGLHGDDQTISNLKFTLEHEEQFKNTTKMFVLNRIVSKKKKKKYIKLLDKYNINYIDIPFDIKKFNELPRINTNLKKFNELSLLDKTSYTLKHNLYLVNNNGCRNFCISYGKEKNYKWTFVLDSNSFFTKDAFNIIIKNKKIKTCGYLIIPQKRLNDHNLQNEILLTKEYYNFIQKLPNNEPQIAFKNTSTKMFNDNIPYGVAPKTELLNALKVNGPWCRFLNTNNQRVFSGNYILKNLSPSINVRKFKNTAYTTTGYIIRLSPQNNKNHKRVNGRLRRNGLLLLIDEIYKKNI